MVENERRAIGRKGHQRAWPIPRPFTYEALPTRVVFGAGASRNGLAEEVDRLGAKRVLLVATGRKSGPAERLASLLAGRLAGRFTGVRTHVPVESAGRARDAAREAGADCLLSVGGGSTTGTAKAVALEMDLPIVAVPTTYAGSEMTPVYGLTRGRRKRTGRSVKVLPRVVIYDPELTFSLPASTTAASAMNAAAHCAEAFYASGANPVASLMAEEGLRALEVGAPVAVARPEDLEGRAHTLYGAYLAAAAFAAAGGGIHHRICHVLGGAYDLPHAETHAAILPQAIAFNEQAIPEAMQRVARAIGAEEAASGLYDLAERIGAPTALGDIGMKREDLAEAVTLVLEEEAARDNPRRVDAAGIRGLLESAYVGRRPRVRAGRRAQ